MKDRAQQALHLLALDPVVETTADNNSYGFRQQRFTQSAATGFIANIFPYRNRVSLKEAVEGPEPDEAKVSRPVLRGPGPSNGARLLG